MMAGAGRVKPRLRVIEQDLCHESGAVHEWEFFERFYAASWTKPKSNDRPQEGVMH